MRKALHEAIGNRIGASNKYDGYSACRLLNRVHSRGTIGHDYVRCQFEQFRGGGSYPIIAPYSPIVVDLQIATDRPPQLLKFLLGESAFGLLRAGP
jgi:hypothetical protein